MHANERRVTRSFSADFISRTVLISELIYVHDILFLPFFILSQLNRIASVCATHVHLLFLSFFGTLHALYIFIITRSILIFVRFLINTIPSTCTTFFYLQSWCATGSSMRL